MQTSLTLGAVPVISSAMRHILLAVALATTAIAQTLAPGTHDPPELANLRTSWQRARQNATAPMDRKYLDALKALKLKLTKVGNLEQALAVDAEIRRVSADPNAAYSTSRIPITATELVQSKWTFVVPDLNWLDVLTFFNDGKVFSKKNSSRGSWSIQNNVLRVEFNNGTTWSEFESDPDRANESLVIRETKCSKERKAGGTMTNITDR